MALGALMTSLLTLCSFGQGVVANPFDAVMEGGKLAPPPVRQAMRIMVAQAAPIPAPISAPRIAPDVIGRPPLRIAIAAAIGQLPELRVAETPAAGPALRILVQPARTAQANAAPAARPRGAEIPRAGDGLFYVDALVNGATVRFLVDTGATAIVLTADDARRAGVASQARFTASADTANGRAAVAQIMLAQMAVGAIEGRQVPAYVSNGGVGVSLLGQSWLAQLDTVLIEGDRMLLR